MIEVTGSVELLEQHKINEVCQQSCRLENDEMLTRLELVEVEQTHDLQQLTDQVDDLGEGQYTTHKIRKPQDEVVEFVHVDHYITKYSHHHLYTLRQ